MNDGIMAMILQWCILCVAWMGVLDRPLKRIGLKPATALAVLTVSLICAFVNWKLYFLPVEINISGFIIPLLVAGWTWQSISFRQKVFAFISVFLSTILLFLVRKMLFGNPVLLVFGEQVIFPFVAVLLFHFMSRNLLYHWFMLVVALPVSDALFVTSLIEQAHHGIIGGKYQQDLFWTTFSLWGVSAIIWLLITKGAASLGHRLISVLRVKTKSNSNR